MRRKNYFSDGILGNQCALLRKKVNPTESMVRMHPSLPSDRGLTLTPPAAHIMYICISTMDLPAVWLTFLPSHSLHTSSVVHRGGCWGLPQLCPNPETTRCSVACEMGVVGVRRTYVATRLTTTRDVGGGMSRRGTACHRLLPPEVHQSFRLSPRTWVGDFKWSCKITKSSYGPNHTTIIMCSHVRPKQP